MKFWYVRFDSWHSPSRNWIISLGRVNQTNTMCPMCQFGWNSKRMPLIDGGGEYTPTSIWLSISPLPPTLSLCRCLLYLRSLNIELLPTRKKHGQLRFTIIGMGYISSDWCCVLFGCSYLRPGGSGKSSSNGMIKLGIITLKRYRYIVSFPTAYNVNGSSQSPMIDVSSYKYNIDGFITEL